MLNIYKDKKVLVTGHTGFKGSWLIQMLKYYGAIVKGYSYWTPSTPNHHDILMSDNSYTGDIRDKFHLESVVYKFEPDIIFHLAAQPLVLKSYEDPYETYTTNFLGTLNLLEACRLEDVQPKAVVIITTDKVYKDQGSINYNEHDQLGGFDPYSNSKACMELITQSYRDSFFNLKDYGDKHNTLIATVRAGNVIGGGDWSVNRIVPDAIRSIVNKETLEVRMPNAVRPFQHVLEPLYGYMKLGKNLLSGYKQYSGAWNFGPDEGNEITVKELLKKIKFIWNELEYTTENNNLHETGTLKLDNFKAKSKLGWFPKYNIDETIKKTVNWYKQYYTKDNVITHKQIDEYLKLI